MKLKTHSITIRVILICLCLPSAILAQPWAEHGKLTVKRENPHYIVHQDGTPFFWFGDTGWELAHRLSRPEVEQYLDNRHKKGFNVVQVVALSEWHHKEPTNYYGDSLFRNGEVSKPVVAAGKNPDNEAEYDYWDHIEFICESAAARSLYVALLPSWGEWITPRGDGPLFNSVKETYDYGWFISNLLRRFPNIIWVLGGDRMPDERKGGVDMWRSMAEGIADATNGVRQHDGKADYTTTLMTFHSFASSATWFHADDWIDIHMWGSYHSDFYLPRSYEQAKHDRALKSPKPTINGEPCYEAHPVNYGLEGNGYFTDVDVRNSAYWSYFSGCAGYTYGAHAVWQFTDSTRGKYSDLTRESWQKELDLPGSYQVKFLRNIVEARASSPFVPNQNMVVEGQGPGANYVSAMHNDRHAMIYVPTGATIRVKLGIVKGGKVKASWYDPRTGQIKPIGSFENKGTRSFEPPGISDKLSWLKTGRGCDWVLILDADESAK